MFGKVDRRLAELQMRENELVGELSLLCVEGAECRDRRKSLLRKLFDVRVRAKNLARNSKKDSQLGPNLDQVEHCKEKEDHLDLREFVVKEAERLAKNQALPWEDNVFEPQKSEVLEEERLVLMLPLPHSKGRRTWVRPLLYKALTSQLGTSEKPQEACLEQFQDVVEDMKQADESTGKTRELVSLRPKLQQINDGRKSPSLINPPSLAFPGCTCSRSEKSLLNPCTVHPTLHHLLGPTKGSRNSKNSHDIRTPAVLTCLKPNPSQSSSCSSRSLPRSQDDRSSPSLLQPPSPTFPGCSCPRTSATSSLISPCKVHPRLHHLMDATNFRSLKRGHKTQH